MNHRRVARQSHRVVRRWFAGAPVLVLQTVGRRSGRLRSAPLLYLRHGGALVGSVVRGHERVRVRPRLLEGTDRDDAWQEFVQMYPQAHHYGEFTDRQFPLIALETLPE